MKATGEEGGALASTVHESELISSQPEAPVSTDPSSWGPLPFQRTPKFLLLVMYSVFRQTDTETDH